MVPFDFLKDSGINDAVANRQPGEILVDVREADEYASGHIPGAVKGSMPFWVEDCQDLMDDHCSACKYSMDELPSSQEHLHAGQYFSFYLSRF